MTISKSEINDLLTIIQRAYPSFYGRANAQTKKAVVSLWQEMLDGEEFEKVAIAVRAVIETDQSGYPPTIGKIKNKVHSLFDKRDMNEYEAWALVSQALKNSAYNSTGEFELLPAIVKRSIGSPETLKRWSCICDPTSLHVASTGFMKRYREELDTEREYRVLSPTVKELVGKAKNGEALGDGEKNLLGIGEDTDFKNGDTEDE